MQLVDLQSREVEQLLAEHYPAPEAKPGRVEEDPPVFRSDGPPSPEANEAPVVRLVQRLLEQAVEAGASDVHLEPFEDRFVIRCRVDGTLREVFPVPLTLAEPVTSRLKVLANLDIAERRAPQDGRIRTRLAGREVDLRLSTLPTQGGESIVLRVLDTRATRLELKTLGLPSRVEAGLRQAVERPHGLLVVTGPTGSGKTTTLYSALRTIDTVDCKILTVEDPVEYELEGVMQVGVNPLAGLGFPTVLRAFLRQDPDVILVGEIRDEETAAIAVQAAQTGHLVLTTLHTIDAATAVTRLVDLGVEPYLVAATLEAVLAQRLVRGVCPQCSEATSGGNGPQLGPGCEHCRGTGYQGRIGLYEWLPATAPLREAIGLGRPADELRQMARDEGMRSLREEGLDAVAAGRTTLDEVIAHT
ncbi:MAG: type II/IV secretion system protein [Verrucomicrobia bacterium]|nr:type II/IV secretion system protein [Verrucomicrobiota bacterium]